MNVLDQLFGEMNTAGLLIFGAVIIPVVAVALVLLIIVVRAGRKVRASQNWRIAKGRVLASYIERRYSRTGEGGTSAAYYPVVAYEYEVGRQHFQGSRIRFGNQIGYGWTGPAQKDVDRFPVGAPVDVYYDPEAPEDAVLERSARGSNRMLLIVVAVIFGTILCTLVMTFGGFALAEQFVRGLGLDALIGAASGK
ncbi:MAG: DUF3592 domain-containing protein [Anaerolinea sp.]|nr:DUF3592 domain-containing protein [Anaerolinea sp.]